MTLPAARFVAVMVMSLTLTTCAPTMRVGLPPGDWELAAEGVTLRYHWLRGAPYTSNAASAVERLEAFIAEIGAEWHVPDVVHYYAFPDRETLREITGWDVTGRAILEHDALVSVYAADAHEIAHILTTPRGRPLRLANLWLEGIAMYYTWPEVYFVAADLAGRAGRIGTWHGRSVHAWAQEALTRGQLPPLSALAFDNRTWSVLDSSLSYPLAGSFITHLVGPGHREAQRFAQLRRFFDDANTSATPTQVEAAFERHLGLRLDVAELHWHAFLREWDEASLNSAAAHGGDAANSSAANAIDSR